ncbi:hypothetical protein ACQCN2_17450 [Brevibacillus ginsengisoli]
MRYTCKDCCNIFQNSEECPVCGKSDVQPIIITVHVQSDLKTLR